MDTPPRTFEEFWPFYVSQHMDPTCRRLHVVGTSCALGLLAVSPIFPPAFVAAPVVGYGLAWVGHFGFEKNRPASWGGARAAWWSLRSDFRMLGRTLRGTMDDEVQKVRDAMEAERSEPPRAPSEARA